MGKACIGKIMPAMNSIYKIVPRNGWPTCLHIQNAHSCLGGEAIPPLFLLFGLNLSFKLNFTEFILLYFDI